MRLPTVRVVCIWLGIDLEDERHLQAWATAQARLTRDCRAIADTRVLHEIHMSFIHQDRQMGMTKMNDISAINYTFIWISIHLPARLDPRSLSKSLEALEESRAVSREFWALCSEPRDKCSANPAHLSRLNPRLSLSQICNKIKVWDRELVSSVAKWSIGLSWLRKVTDTFQLHWNLSTWLFVIHILTYLSLWNGKHIFHDVNFGLL